MNVRVWVTGLLACSLAVVPRPTSACTCGIASPNAALTARVKAALVAEPTVKARDVNVESFRGTVQLSGFVDDQRQIERAVEIARGSEGVKSVKNDLRIKMPPASGSSSGAGSSSTMR